MWPSEDEKPNQSHGNITGTFFMAPDRALSSNKKYLYFIFLHETVCSRYSLEALC